MYVRCAFSSRSQFRLVIGVYLVDSGLFVNDVGANILGGELKGITRSRDYKS